MTSLSNRVVAAAFLSGIQDSQDDGAVMFPAEATTVLTRRRWLKNAGFLIWLQDLNSKHLL